jgi:cytochrome P450
MDLIEDFAFRLPVTIICEMLGIPEDHREVFYKSSRDGGRLLDPVPLTPEEIKKGNDGNLMAQMYFQQLFELRRRNPGDDLTTQLVQAEEDGYKLTNEELTANIILLFGAGHETTVNLISGGVLNFLRHPDQLQRLRDDPSLITSAVEELLRFGPPVQLVARNATTGMEFAAHHIEQGNQLIPMVACANRDPDVFEDPDRLDIGRVDNRHVSFGGGIHLCLGAPLARVEGQEAIGRLVQRFPSIELESDEVEWKPTSTLRGPARLRLVLR